MSDTPKVEAPTTAPLDRALDMVLSRLEGVKEESGDRSYVARCPAHDDHNPSLGIWVKGEDICVACRSQRCSQHQILGAIGLIWSDLRAPYAGKGTKTPHRVVAVYDYKDADGALIGQVVRYDPKDFRQRPASAIVGVGKGSWKMGRVELPLYGLLSLLAAKAEGRDAWLVEGEKDVATCWTLGLAGTTTPGGASKPGAVKKWRPAYTEALRGFKALNVVVDTDAAGELHAARILQELGGVIPTLRFWRAAKGKDLTDHIAAGYSVDQLVAVDAASLPVASPTGTGQHPVADDPAVTEFNQRWAVMLSGGNAVLETPKTGAPRFHPFDRWQRFMANQQVEVPTTRGTKLIPFVEHWLRHPERRGFTGVVFDPTLAPHTGVPSRRGNTGDQDFNFWPGFALEPSTEGSCELFLDHLLKIVCRDEADLYTWVLMWLADIVQHPERLIGTSLALRGPQGTGKSIVGAVMGVILGEALYLAVSKPDELTGRFNSHHQARLLLQVEEGFFAGDRRAEGALKHMITSKTVMIEPKFVDPFPVENFIRLLITSNKEWVIPAGFGERRFAVLDVSEAVMDNRAYHGALREQMFAKGGCARLLHHLLHEVTVNELVIWRPPATSALVEQQLESLSDEDTWLLDILSTGEIPGDEGAKGEAPTDVLHAHYLRYLRDHGGPQRSRRSSETKLGIFLRQKAFGTYVVTVRENGKRWYVFPPLSDCRAAFAERLAREVPWLSASTTWRKSSYVVPTAHLYS
jgi:Family of unknown function (DUF5906)